MRLAGGICGVSLGRPQIGPDAQLEPSCVIPSSLLPGYHTRVVAGHVSLPWSVNGEAGPSCLALATAPLAASAQTAAPRTLDIYFIDVEGGQATLVVTPSGQTLLCRRRVSGHRRA